MKIDLNCDLGESFGIYTLGHDDLMMDYVSSINVACGMHAGDPDVMMRTIKLAIQKGISIGAHPGYPDLVGFGRRNMDLSLESLQSSIIYQVGALKTMVEALGGKLRHVKAHGALYNKASKDYETAYTLVKAIQMIDKNLVVMGLAGSETIRACKDLNMPFARELFADRRYTSDLKLQSRSEAGSVLLMDESIDQCKNMIINHSVIDLNGKHQSLEGDTICIHGDNIKGVELVKKLRDLFKSEGIEVTAI